MILTVDQATAGRLRGQPVITLLFRGVKVGSLDLVDVSRIDRDEVCPKLFGTTDAAHPGVAALYRGGNYILAGPVRLTQRVAFEFSAFEMTPAETRAYFAAQNWRTVAGFQTRNVPHRAHEYLQRVALEVVDGLFIQPLVGRKKVGDYTPEAVLAGYRCLIDGFYPPDRVLLGILSTAMRYAGPREAIFHAIVRRNYGCTHFIVGRDHAGVGGYYGKYAAHDLITQFEGELGISILRLHGPYYCGRCGGIVTDKTCPHIATDPTATTEISGTLMRSILLGGGEPLPHLMRPEVVSSLQGLPLFVEEGDA